MKVRLAVTAVAVAALAIGALGSAGAQLLNGSLPLAGIVVTQNGADLLASTSVSDAFAITSGFGATDYAPIPLGTTYGTTTLDFTNFTTFSLSNATFGSFATTSGSFITHHADFVDVLLLGVYSPGPGLPGFVPTPASLRISINQSGASLSEAITLNSPPLGVPEPGTYAFGVTSALGGLLMLRRRKMA